MAHCHSCSDKLTHWTFTCYLIANSNFPVRMILAYLANAQAQASQIKIEIEPSFT